MLAITPIDCGDACFAATLLYPLTMIAAGAVAFAAVGWLHARRAHGAPVVSADDGLALGDIFLAAQDGALLGLIGFAVASRFGVSAVVAPVVDIGISDEAISIVSASAGCFLVLLGLRSIRRRPRLAFWPEVRATAFVALAYATVCFLGPRALVGGAHAWPCIAPRPNFWALVAAGAIVASAGSLAGRASFATSYRGWEIRNSG